MKIVISGICGALNSGDHTQLQSLLVLLREAFPSAHIFCIHRNPDLHSGLFRECTWFEQIGTCHSFNMLVRRATNSFWLSAAMWDLPSLLPDRQKATYEVLRGADLTVACPGGYLEDGSLSIFANIAHLSIPLRNRRPLFLAPQSIGPFRHPWIMRRVSHILGESRTICVREPNSLTYVTSTMGVPAAQVSLYPDMAFYERDADANAANKVLESLGISHDEPIAGTTLWPVSQRAISEATYFRCLSHVANHLHAVHGMRTVVLRQAGEAKGVRGDGELLRRAEPFFDPSTVFSHTYHSPEVLRGIIGRCRVFYGTRMHSNIFALAQGVPTVAIAYHPKTEGIMRMCGQDRYAVALSEVGASRICDLLDSAIANSSAIKHQLFGVMKQFDSKRNELIELLRANYAS